MSKQTAVFSITTYHSLSKPSHVRGFQNACCGRHVCSPQILRRCRTSTGFLWMATDPPSLPSATVHSSQSHLELFLRNRVSPCLLHRVEMMANPCPSHPANYVLAFASTLVPTLETVSGSRPTLFSRRHAHPRPFFQRLF